MSVMIRHAAYKKHRGHKAAALVMAIIAELSPLFPHPIPYTMNTPDSKTVLLYAILSICWGVSMCWLLYRQKSTVPTIPGSSGVFSSYVAALRFLYGSQEMISSGLFRWEYIVNGPKRLVEVAAAPEHILSFIEPLEDLVGRVVRLRSEWKLVQIYPASLQVVARTSNRLYVDLPGSDYWLLAQNPPTNDLVSWLLKLAEGEERMTPALALRVLVANAVSIHTTSMALTSALYDLTTPRVYAPKHCAHPPDTRRSREGGLHLRLSKQTTIMLAHLMAFAFRACVKSVTAILSVAELAVSTATRSPPRSLCSWTHDLFSTVFFAATEIKAMLAHILINYDLKAETDIRPPTVLLAGIPIPNPRGKIWIRKRQG
ncbi:hypothetical protein B0H19DRAFT_1065518 [Mycena capillaripes]|nr:hypothetical protein B0H19DRAFT_1065518 [Mycena capillaripes]